MDYILWFWWTMDYGLYTMDYGLWTMDYGLWTMDYILWTMDYGLWTMDQEGAWTMDYEHCNFYHEWSNIYKLSKDCGLGKSTISYWIMDYVEYENVQYENVQYEYVQYEYVEHGLLNIECLYWLLVMNHWIFGAWLDFDKSLFWLLTLDCGSFWLLLTTVVILTILWLALPVSKRRHG